MILKRRAWVFRWLREKLGINSLAAEVYKNKTPKREKRKCHVCFDKGIVEFDGSECLACTKEKPPTQREETMCSKEKICIHGWVIKACLKCTPEEKTKENL